MNLATVVIGITSLLVADASAKADSADRLGRKVSLPTLRDFRGAEIDLAKLSARKTLCVVFLGTECPLARMVAPKLAEIAQEFADKNVVLIGVDSNIQDTQAELAEYVRTHRITFPVVRDPGQRFADELGAERTPESVVIDQNNIIRYVGRVDDQFGKGIQKPHPTRRDLAQAIEEVVARKNVSVASTTVSGCFIGREKKTSTASGDVTYTKQVARILQDRCVECHRAGEVAPFSLTSYQDARDWAESVVEVTSVGRMPPWFASPDHLPFQNAGIMRDDEKKTLRDWLAAGCPEGDPKDLPPGKVFTDGWGMEKPDLVIKMADTPFHVPATGVLDYVYYTVDPGWTEDKWLRGAEARAGVRSVVHHILVFLQKPGVKYFEELPGELIAGYAPGMKATVAPDKMGLHAPAGSKIVFQIHYTPDGAEHDDMSFAGFRYCNPKEVEWEIKSNKAMNAFFRIPPHHDSYQVKASFTFPKEAMLLGVNPHMHLRGKSFQYVAHYPDGKKQILMDCPKFDFNWQIGYQYVNPPILPAYTSIACTATFDNSEANLSNPDPTRWVKFGKQTWQEMMIGWFFYAEKIDRSHDSRFEFAGAR